MTILVDRKSHSEIKNITSKVESGSSGYPDCSDYNLETISYTSRIIEQHREKYICSNRDI
jgi:hypothetical protein